MEPVKENKELYGNAPDQIVDPYKTLLSQLEDTVTHGEELISCMRQTVDTGRIVDDTAVITRIGRQSLDRVLTEITSEMGVPFGRNEPEEGK